MPRPTHVQKQRVLFSATPFMADRNHSSGLNTSLGFANQTNASENAEAGSGSHFSTTKEHLILFQRACSHSFEQTLRCKPPHCEKLHIPRVIRLLERFCHVRPVTRSITKCTRGHLLHCSAGLFIQAPAFHKVVRTIFHSLQTQTIVKISRTTSHHILQLSQGLSAIKTQLSAAVNSFRSYCSAQ